MTAPAWICGERLTGGELWLSGVSGMHGLVQSLIDRNVAFGVTNGDSAVQRKAIAIAIADELQAQLIEEALRDGTWAWEQATSEELDTLCHPRGEVIGAGLSWKPTGLPLTFVPTTAGESPPRGRVLPVSWATDRALLVSLVDAGFYEGGTF